MIAVGIDPGLTGAISFIDSRGSVAIEDMPTVDLPGNGLVRRRVDGMALAQLLRRYIPAGNAALVIVEDVHAMGGSAVQTMGSMMRSLGAIEATLEVLRLPPRMVSPRTWKGHFGLKADKAASLQVARTLYPAAASLLARVRDHNRAEALLLAHWGKGELA